MWKATAGMTNDKTNVKTNDKINDKTDMGKNMGHMDEELNQRSRYLRILRRIWIIPAAAAVLGLVFFAGSMLSAALSAGNRQYQAVSKLYIDFAKDDTGTVYDYYNGATWTDLLTADPDISDTIVQNLPVGTDLAAVKAEAKAEILTDIRLLTVTVTDRDPQRAADIRDAVDEALVHFGDTAKEFTSIRLLSTEEPQLVTVSYRTGNAVLLGVFLGALAGLFFLLITETLDDAVYVPEDAERRYGLPVLGITAKAGQETTPEQKRELQENTDHLGAAGACSVSAEDTPDYGKLRENGAILEVVFGKKDGTKTDHLLSQLKKQDCRVYGIIIRDADETFLERYYRTGKKHDRTGGKQEVDG
jgi:capsular polysaccharide biosynthesis protein